MRIARKLALLATIATAATALMATTANAQVEVVEEDTANHCVPSCPIHANGEIHLFRYLFGFESEVMHCVVELEGHIGENGEAQIESALLTNHPGSVECDVTPCSLPWPIHVEEPAPGVKHMILEFCLNDGGTLRSCLIELPLSENPFGSHDHESLFTQPGQVGFIANHGNASNCKLDGQLHLETSAGHPEIEIVH